MAEDDQPSRQRRTRPPAGRDLIRPGTVSEALQDPNLRESLELPTDETTPMDVVVELNLLHESGLEGADTRFKQLYAKLGTREKPELVATTYYRCRVSGDDIRKLVSIDQENIEPSARAIYRVWPDFPVNPMIDRSVSTVKADAARNSYEATGKDIVWAVIDSGVAEHPHFDRYDTLEGDVARLHRDFTQPGRKVRTALTDEYGHGTHVAGIIAGALKLECPNFVGQHVIDVTGKETVQERKDVSSRRLTGVAPQCKIVSLKVLSDKGTSRSTDVLRALQYVREKVNGHGKLLRIHGVNLSVGYEFDARWFACGQSPICVEVDRLVQSGVVVVVAAGNTGYGEQSSNQRFTNTGLTLTINDPGNAELAITVGATHRDAPPGGDDHRPSRRCSARPGAVHRRQRNEHGGPACIGGDRVVPVDPPGVHRASAGGQAHLPRERDVARPRAVLRGPRHGGSDARHPGRLTRERAR
jgi:serine protease AprX